MITEDKTEIEQLFIAYQHALSALNVSDITSLYTADGQFLATQAPTATGLEEIGKAYDMLFKNIQLNLTFHIEEIAVSDDLGYVRTHSDGTNLVRATGQVSPEENRELFVLKKENNRWKFARYMFNKTK